MTTQTLQPFQNLQTLPTYVINLDRRPDRWKHASQMLTKHNFTNVRRISAIDGKKIDSKQLELLVFNEMHKNFGKIRKTHEEIASVGAVGCYLSHYKAWMKVLESGVPSLICEDDLVMKSQWMDFNTQKNLQKLSTYDLVLLGYSNLRDHNVSTIKTPGFYPLKGMFFGLMCYYLSPKGAEILLHQALPIKYQVDSYMAIKCKSSNTIRCAFYYPSIVTQTGDSTDIQTPHSVDENVCKWSKFTKFVIVVSIIIALLIMCKIYTLK